MKPLSLILISFILFVSLFKSVGAVEYPLSVSTNSSSVQATLQTPPEDNQDYQLQIANQNTFSSDTLVKSLTNKAMGGLVVWKISDLKWPGTYYFRVVKPSLGNVVTWTDETVSVVKMVENQKVVDSNIQPVVLTWPLKYGADPDNENTIIFAGQIDLSKNIYPARDYNVTLYVGTNQSFSGARQFSAKNGDVSNPQLGIGSDGVYYFVVNNLTPSAHYLIKQEAKIAGDLRRTDTGGFTAKDGFMASDQAVGANSDDKRVYHLLAPWPGLNKIMDSAMCQAEKNLQTIPQNSICDINGFLNFLFKFLIGLAAVVLVLRLMFEGYQYMVTDVPFLKASAKSGFMNALIGLLLALSAYLILNTLNPKLVDNNIHIDSVDLGVEPGNDGLGVESESSTRHQLTLITKNNQPLIVTACDPSQMVNISAFGTNFQIEKNLLPSIKRIDTKWRKLNPAYKIPMTITDQKMMGGYVCRGISGKKKLSYHAYGLAVDINPMSNPQGDVLKTDMPQSFVNLWREEGWGWGGDWSSSKDAMHFSKGKNEGGNMIGD